MASFNLNDEFDLNELPVEDEHANAKFGPRDLPVQDGDDNAGIGNFS